MAVVRKFINPDIDYGNPTDERMNVTTIVTPTTIPINQETAEQRAERRKTGVPNANYCPDGGIYLGQVNGKPLCHTAPKKYAYNPDKQAAYEKAEAEGIQWTGQYTKNESTGEVAPKPIEVVVQEKANELNSETKKAIESGTISDNSINSLVKKYWWVLIAAGVGYLLFKKEN